MNIGIMVYSETGNTLSVAEKLREKLVAAGHTAAIERVTVDGDPRKMGVGVAFGVMPDTTPYDALVFASPVHGFSLSLPMAGYLKQVSSLDGKAVACLVSHALPYPWMGGTRAIRQMAAICESKGARMCGSGIVNWMRSSRDQEIADVADVLSRAF